MTHYILGNAQIMLVFALWILSCFGFGFALISAYEKYMKVPLFGEYSDVYSIFRIFSALIFGILFLCFLVQILNFFIPINAVVSNIILTLGILCFLYFIKAFWLDKYLTLAGFLAFILVLPLTFLSDSVGDSVNYHIQIVTWIQQSPVIFGLGNIHGRLGFNGLIYNFYALSDVSLIFPSNRSFIGNEICYFGFFLTAFYIFIKRDFTRLSLLFVVCATLPFPFILTWGEFQGLYCEGIGAVLGIFVITFSLISCEIKNTRLLYISFIIAIFAAMIKIANSALVCVVLLTFVALLKNNILTKHYLKSFLILFAISAILTIPWALKGIMTSGMIAYPTAIFYIESLPWAVSQAQRESEVCWIMSWARDPGKNCVEVLSSHSWMIDWFSMKTRYFAWYFKYFVYTFFGSIALFVALRIYTHYTQKHMSSFVALDKSYIWVFCGIVCGLLFWFFSGPDPRFGMVYIIPAISFLIALNINAIFSITSKPFVLAFTIALLCSVVPLFLNGRPAFVIVWIILILMHKIPYRIYLPLLIISFILCIPNLYRKVLTDIKEMPKVRTIYVEEKITDYGLKIYVRKDSPNEYTQDFLYEPLPSGPYFNETMQKHLRETQYFHRRAYTYKDE